MAHPLPQLQIELELRDVEEKDEPKYREWSNWRPLSDKPLLSIKHPSDAFKFVSDAPL